MSLSLLSVGAYLKKERIAPKEQVLSAKSISFLYQPHWRCWRDILVWAICLSIQNFPVAGKIKKCVLGSWNLICDIGMKNEQMHIFYLLTDESLQSYVPFSTLALYLYGILWTKCLEHYLCWGCDIWHTL